MKGWTGELKTKVSQALFLDLKEYHVFNNVLIKIGSRTTQIDHIIVSKYGVFVVDTKNRNGWIYGKSNEAQWTEVFYKKKFRFQNPLRQNYLHTKSLAELLRINHNLIFSVIVFWGNCRFKTVMPDNVLNNTYTNYVKSKKLIFLHDQEVERICQELSIIKANTSFLDGWRHTQALKRRHQNILTDENYQGLLIKPGEQYHFKKSG
jgi:restriction system protein